MTWRPCADTRAPSERRSRGSVAKRQREYREARRERMRYSEGVGGGGWTRTTDIGLMRPPLCQLSYAATGRRDMRLCSRKSPRTLGRMIEKRRDGVKAAADVPGEREGRGWGTARSMSVLRSRFRRRLRSFQPSLLLVSLPLDVLWFVILGIVRSELVNPPVKPVCGDGDYRESDQHDQPPAQALSPPKPAKRPRVDPPPLQGDLEAHAVQDLRCSLGQAPAHAAEP